MMRLHNCIYIGLVALAAMITAGCVDNSDRMLNADAFKQHPIRISSVYPSMDIQTRATIDGGFVEGDAMGIFVVDRDADGEAVTPMLGSGRASNVRFTLGEDGTWKGAAQLYWDPKGSAADFYGYYPFDDNLSSVTNNPFVVQSHQDAENGTTSASNYGASDLLWAKMENVEPTIETVTLQYSHLMAGVTIRLEMGSGFTAQEWASFEKTVLLKNTVTAGIVNLATGEVKVSTDGGVKDIVPLLHNGTWRAVTYPQTVKAGQTLVSVTIDGQSYALKKDAAMNFIPGKMHTFTITVDRREAGGQFTFMFSDEAITPWVDDPDLHDGLVREYVIVEVSEPGKLAEDLVRMGKDYRTVESLKVMGDINQSDLEFMGREMMQMMNLNLQKARIVADENGEGAGYMNFHRSIWDWANGTGRHKLTRFVFPEEGVTRVGGFTNSYLKGELVIPEGVTLIDEYAFFGCEFNNNTITLPSTLKRIEQEAFSFDCFVGPLNLPEGIEYIDPGGYYVFQGSDFSGALHIPSSLKVSCPFGFPKMTGDIIIPQGWTTVPSFGGGGYDGIVVLPEGLEEIDAFGGTKIHGEVKIPSTCKVLGGFGGTLISGVIFPENLLRLKDGAFSGCTRLSGTIELPKKIAEIPRNCFRDSPLLTGVVIPASTVFIGEYAFTGCTGLNSIVCEGEEPPFVQDNAFLGVPKDNFTIEVPKGCVEKYRNARGWSDFKRIAEYSNFVCRPAQVCALNSVHSEDLVLNADGPWTVARKPDWCTLSATSGTGKTALTVNIIPLEHGAGARQDTIVFAMESGGKTFETVCVLRQYDYEHDEDSYIALQKATKGNNGGIDIVFAGDGFDGASISDGSYLDLVEYQTECFFAVEPYKSMREYFNVYVTFPLSQEKGVNTMYTYVNNHFGTLYGMNELTSSEITSTALITESDEVMDYVVQRTPVKSENLWRTLVILVPNSTDYDGHTEFMDNGAALSICPPSDKPYPKDTRGVIQHEAGGHGFGKLGDEEITRNAFASSKVKGEVENMHGRGWYDNLATTGKLSQVPWADFIFDTRYSDYVDVYEGGYGYTRGIYRPEVNSCMNYGIPYYNTPSRLSIFRRIKDYAGEEFRMEDFLAGDTFEWGTTNVTRAAAMDMDNLVPYTTGSHQAPVMTDFRANGNKVRSIRERLRREKLNK